MVRVVLLDDRQGAVAIGGEDPAGGGREGRAVAVIADRQDLAAVVGTSTTSFSLPPQLTKSRRRPRSRARPVGPSPGATGQSARTRPVARSIWATELWLSRLTSACPRPSKTMDSDVGRGRSGGRSHRSRRRSPRCWNGCSRPARDAWLGRTRSPAAAASAVGIVPITFRPAKSKTVIAPSSPLLIRSPSRDPGRARCRTVQAGDRAQLPAGIGRDHLDACLGTWRCRRVESDGEQSCPRPGNGAGASAPAAGARWRRGTRAGKREGRIMRDSVGWAGAGSVPDCRTRRRETASRQGSVPARRAPQEAARGRRRFLQVQ